MTIYMNNNSNKLSLLKKIIKPNSEMKKILFSVTFMALYITTVYSQKSVITTATLKIFDASAVTIFDTAASNQFKFLLSDSGYGKWAIKDPYTEISMLYLFNMFKGERISNYYNGDSLVGFSCRFNEHDLPPEILNSIEKRYSNCVITDVIIFMDVNGTTQYYASIKNNKRYIALKISATGKLTILKKISTNEE
jgi:hypothetical protein